MWLSRSWSRPIPSAAYIETGRQLQATRAKTRGAIAGLVTRVQRAVAVGAGRCDCLRYSDAGNNEIAAAASRALDSIRATKGERCFDMKDSPDCTFEHGTWAIVSPSIINISRRADEIPPGRASHRGASVARSRTCFAAIGQISYI